MLILPDGYAKFQQDIHNFTPGHNDGRKLRREIGYQPSPNAIQKEQEMSFKGWKLPKNFCIDCGKTDVTPEAGLDGKLRLNPGLTVIEEPRPDIGLTIGDFIVSWICHRCLDTENWGQINIHGPVEKRVFFEACHTRREKNAFEWIKAAILRGEEPVQGDRT